MGDITYNILGNNMSNIFTFTLIITISIQELQVIQKQITDI